MQYSYAYKSSSHSIHLIDFDMVICMRYSGQLNRKQYFSTFNIENLYQSCVDLANSEDYEDLTLTVIFYISFIYELLLSVDYYSIFYFYL